MSTLVACSCIAIGYAVIVVVAWIIGLCVSSIIKRLRKMKTPTLLIVLLAAILAFGGCGSTPDFSRYRVELDLYLSGDTAVCGSAAIVDTTGGFRIGFDDKCFTFRKGQPRVLIPIPVTGEP